MVIEISSANDLFNVTFNMGYLIEEQIQSPEVQQQKREPKLDTMVQMRKNFVLALGVVRPPHSHPMKNPVQNPPITPT